MNRFFRFTILLLLACALAGVCPLLADGSLFGTLAGKVKDESGGALPGVAIEVRSIEKGFVRTATTDSAGAFSVPLLPPGRYTTKATIQGFESFVSDGDVIEAERTTDVTINLKLATTRESVEVIGTTPLVDRTNTTDTTTVRSELTDKLPVVRGYQNVIDFAPGQNDVNRDGNPNARGAPDSANSFSTASTRRTRRRAPSAPTTTSTRSKRSSSRTTASRRSTAGCRAACSTSSRSRARTSSTARAA